MCGPNAKLFSKLSNRSPIASSAGLLQLVLSSFSYPRFETCGSTYLEKLVENWIECVLLDFRFPLSTLALIRQQINFDISVTRSGEKNNQGRIKTLLCYTASNGNVVQCSWRYLLPALCLRHEENSNGSEAY